MEISRICFIINPSAGKEEPVSEHISEIFAGSGITCSIHELQKGEVASDIAMAQVGKYDLIAVYGGDGSVTQTASGLIGTKIPLAIIPGGTANVLAKELNIPQDTLEALKMIRDGRFQLKVIDTGVVNGTPFLLRVNMGIMAEMITEADLDLKNQIGQLAYGISAFQTTKNAEPVEYVLEIDGKTEQVQGVSLTVTNSGNMGLGDLQLFPGISMTDGLLDILLLKDAHLLSIIKAASSSLLQQETDTIRHWTCRKVTITMPQETLYLCDDCEDKANKLTIEVVPSSLTIAVPFNK